MNDPQARNITRHQVPIPLPTYILLYSQMEKHLENNIPVGEDTCWYEIINGLGMGR